MCDDYEYLNEYYDIMDRNYNDVDKYRDAIEKFERFYEKYDNSSNSQTPIISGQSGVPTKTAHEGCNKLIEKHGDKMTADSQIFEFDYYYYYPNKDVGDDVSREINRCNEKIIYTLRSKAGDIFSDEEEGDEEDDFTDWLEDYKPPGKIKMKVLDTEHNKTTMVGKATPELYRAMRFFNDYGEKICKGGKEYIPHEFVNQYGEWFITENEDDNELLLGVPIRRKCYFLLDNSKGGFNYGYVEFHDHLVCVNKIISDNVIKFGRRVQQPRRTRRGGGKSKTSKKRKNTKRRKNIKKKSSKKKRTKRRRRTKRR